MNQKPPKTVANFRFSLREMMLLMVAIGSLLGWGVTVWERSRPFEPTPFFLHHENWQQDVTEIMQSLGEEGLDAASGGSTNNAGKGAVRRLIAFRLPLSQPNRKAFLDAFELCVLAKLRDNSCQTGGTATGSGNIALRNIIYSHGPVGGVVEICMTEAGNGQVGLTLNMVETNGHFFSTHVKPWISTADQQRVLSPNRE